MKRAVAIAEQNRCPAAVSRYSYDEILDRIAVKIADVDVRAINKECVSRERDRRLLQKCAIADAEKRVDPRIIAGDCKIFNGVAIEVAHCDSRHSGANFDLDRKLERAVAKAE